MFYVVNLFQINICTAYTGMKAISVSADHSRIEYMDLFSAKIFKDHRLMRENIKIENDHYRVRAEVKTTKH